MNYPRYAIFVVLLSTLSAQSQTLDYKLDLRSYGYVAILHPKAGLESDIADTRHIAIDGSGKAYVGFSMETAPVLLRHGDTSNIFRVLTISLKNRAVDDQRDFATASTRRVGVNVTASDKLLVTANDAVQLLDTDKMVRRTFAIPPKDARGSSGWSIQLSPSGRTLMVKTTVHHVYILEADSLEPRKDCQVFLGRNLADSFSDTMKIKMGGYHASQSGGREYDLQAGALCENSERLKTYADVSPQPFFLDNATLINVGSAPTISQLNLSGATLWVEELYGAELWRATLPAHMVFGTSHVAVARSGNRFAAFVTEVHGGSDFFDTNWTVTSRRVVVYDTGLKRQIGEVALPKPWNGEPEVALSPEGDRVAIVKDGVLEVWKL